MELKHFPSALKSQMSVGGSCFVARVKRALALLLSHLYKSESLSCLTDDDAKKIYSYIYMYIYIKTRYRLLNFPTDTEECCQIYIYVSILICFRDNGEEVLQLR